MTNLQGGKKIYKNPTPILEIMSWLYHVKILFSMSPQALKIILTPSENMSHLKKMLKDKCWFPLVTNDENGWPNANVHELAFNTAMLKSFAGINYTDNTLQHFLLEECRYKTISIKSCMSLLWIHNKETV